MSSVRVKYYITISMMLKSLDILFPPTYYEVSKVTDYDATLHHVSILYHKLELENTLEKVINVSQ